MAASPGSATAVWFPAARSVELRSQQLPLVGPADVRIKALASGISHGTEMLVYRGQVPAGTSLDLPTLEGSFAFPIKYGYASVGTVCEVGSDVTGLQPGDLVFAHHPHQTEYVLPATFPVPLPAGLAPERGVFLANVETAVNILLDAHPRLGERVVIFGQGVVGLLVTQLLRRVGTGLIIAVDPVRQRRELALRVGADVALPPAPDLSEQVHQLTEGIGADLVLEVSGNPAALGAALDCAAFQGTVVVCSWYGAKPVSVPLGGAFHRGRLRVISSQVGNIDPALSPRWDRQRRTNLARQLLTELDLSPLVTHHVPFEKAGAAYNLIDERPEEVIQVILTYGGEDV